MSGQMCWLARFVANEEKILHLRLEPHHPWKPYTSLVEYAVPDYTILGGSRGMATFHKFLKAGWAVVSSDEASKTQVLPSSEMPVVKSASG